MCARARRHLKPEKGIKLLRLHTLVAHKRTRTHSRMLAHMPRIQMVNACACVCVCTYIPCTINPPASDNKYSLCSTNEPTVDRRRWPNCVLHARTIYSHTHTPVLSLSPCAATSRRDNSLVEKKTAPALGALAQLGTYECAARLREAFIYAVT